MPGGRCYRNFSEKQKVALQKRKKTEIWLFNPPGMLYHDPAQRNGWGRLQKGPNSELNDFLDAYDARLIELDHRYPIGHRDRFEWMEEHRKVWTKILIKLLDVSYR
jgi:hypothetical protein